MLLIKWLSDLSSFKIHFLLNKLKVYYKNLVFQGVCFLKSEMLLFSVSFVWTDTSIKYSWLCPSWELEGGSSCLDSGGIHMLCGFRNDCVPVRTECIWPATPHQSPVALAMAHEPCAINLLAPLMRLLSQKGDAARREFGLLHWKVKFLK